MIRTAARMAEAFHSQFTALYVKTSDTDLEEDSSRRLRANVRLAEELGAQITTVYGDDPLSRSPNMPGRAAFPKSF